jgi:hypothetical protein
VGFHSTTAACSDGSSAKGSRTVRDEPKTFLPDIEINAFSLPRFGVDLSLAVYDFLISFR